MDMFSNDQFGGNIYLGPYGNKQWIRDKINHIKPFLLKNSPAKIKTRVEAILNRVENKKLQLSYIVLKFYFSQLQTYVCLCKIKTKNMVLGADLFTGFV
jgi:hypothetical protein